MSLFVQQNGIGLNNNASSMDESTTASTSATPKPSIASLCGGEVGAGIREVWAGNLEEEFRLMRQIVQKYPFVSLDTEFPGVVMRPLGEFETQGDYHYQKMKLNVDALKLIQVGFTFMDEKGQVPPDFSTWQFNFKFSLQEDMFAQGSVDLLFRSGIQFSRMVEDGIPPDSFAELLMTSGLVLCDNVTWLSFHSAYDFGYLMKCLMNRELPEREDEFFELAKLFFPKIYDIKVLVGRATQYRGGLQELAEQLLVERVGAQHQAGSDSLVTGHTFFKIKETYFKDDWLEMLKYEGLVFGLGSVCSQEGLGGMGNGSPLSFEAGRVGVVMNAPGRELSASRSAAAAVGAWEGAGGSSTDNSTSATPESLVSNGDRASASQ